MLIQINTDRNIGADKVEAGRVEDKLRRALDRFGEQVTRVELHLRDENSDKKASAEDKRCQLEVRLAGRQPISVSHAAATVEQAVDGAVEKARRALESALGRADRRGRADPPPGGEG